MANGRCAVTGLGLRDGEICEAFRIEPEYADPGVKPGVYAVGPETLAYYQPKRLAFLIERGCLPASTTDLPSNFYL